ncbi:hypothetical protein C8J57DRAFT_1255064 [Mycena rebaudengoi]|nr:hypothetical protein C8J57DRAFT_1255064 [Mycena rebaudengoi]
MPMRTRRVGYIGNLLACKENERKQDKGEEWPAGIPGKLNGQMITLAPPRQAAGLAGLDPLGLDLSRTTWTTRRSKDRLNAVYTYAAQYSNSNPTACFSLLRVGPRQANITPLETLLIAPFGPPLLQHFSPRCHKVQHTISHYRSRITPHSFAFKVQILASILHYMSVATVLACPLPRPPISCPGASPALIFGVH